MTEKFSERTAGVWIPLVIYAVGGVYSLAFWAVFDRSAYHLIVLGVLSVAVSVALYSLSKWGYWLGLFAFPLIFANFAYALQFSVNLSGWNPDNTTAVFNGSLVAYLALLVFSFVFLIDRRNALKNDRVLDRFGKVFSAPAKSQESKSDSAGA